MSCTILLVRWSLVLASANFVSCLHQGLRRDRFRREMRQLQPRYWSPGYVSTVSYGNKMNAQLPTDPKVHPRGNLFVARPFETTQTKPSIAKDFNDEETISHSPSASKSPMNSASDSTSITSTTAGNSNSDAAVPFAGSGIFPFDNSILNMRATSPSPSSTPMVSVAHPQTFNEWPGVAIEPQYSGILSPSNGLLQKFNDDSVEPNPPGREDVAELAEETPVTFVMPFSKSKTTLSLPQMVADPAGRRLPLVAPSASNTPSTSPSPTPSPTPSSSQSMSSSPSPSENPSSTPSPSPTTTPSSSPSPSTSSKPSPSQRSETGPSCICAETCIDEFTRQYGGTCVNGVCVNQLFEDCSVNEGPLECNDATLTRGVCLNSACTTEAYICQSEPCDASGVYKVPYSSTGGGTRRQQAGDSEVEISGCATTFCESTSFVRCGVQSKVGVCQKFGSPICQIVDNSGASV